MPICRMIPKINDIHCAIGDGRKKFVVTGCGRSGTLYMRRLFLLFGYDLGHEGFRRDGIVSWYIAEPARAEFVRSYFKRNFPDTTYIHLVRDPIKVINSMYKLLFLPNRAALDFFDRAYPEFNSLGSLEKVMVWWRVWNQNCEIEYPMAQLLQIEDIRTPIGFEGLCNLLEIEKSHELWRKVQRLNPSIHTLPEISNIELREKGITRDIIFEDLYSANSELALSIRENALKYGYRI